MDHTKALADFRMDEWGLTGQSRRIRTSVRRVLSELSAESLYALKDPRLEVIVKPERSDYADLSVWAYFPVYRRRKGNGAARPRATAGRPSVVCVAGGTFFVFAACAGKIRRIVLETCPMFH